MFIALVMTIKQLTKCRMKRLNMTHVSVYILWICNCTYYMNVYIKWTQKHTHTHRLSLNQFPQFWYLSCRQKWHCTNAKGKHRFCNHHFHFNGYFTCKPQLSGSVLEENADARWGKSTTGHHSFLAPEDWSIDWLIELRFNVFLDIK